MLVPEIALTPAVAALFRGAFGDRVAIQHSGLSDGERHDQWQRIRRGDVDVVVGTRSAVFAPLTRLGLVIVDEEHDTSYKQEESAALSRPRRRHRCARSREGALVVLGSATPSLETLPATRSRQVHAVVARAARARPAAGRGARRRTCATSTPRQAPDVVISRALAAAIEERLARREQVLVLLNRRGYATAVFCRQCGDTFECPNCSVSLTVHGGAATAGARAATTATTRCMVPKACRKCAAPYLEHTGFGTEKVEQQLARAVSRGAHRPRRSRLGPAAGARSRRCWRASRARELDVLVGTQMIAKGHDFPRVTLVGVISADVGLGLADFRAAERTFQLLTQVAGRAGRGERPGEAIVQTLYPEHYSVQLRVRAGLRRLLRARSSTSARRCAIRRSSRWSTRWCAGATFEEAMHDGRRAGVAALETAAAVRRTSSCSGPRRRRWRGCAASTACSSS